MTIPCYFAPLEGITDATFRRLHHKYFPGVSRYYMPFLSPTMHRCLSPREARELPRADSQDFLAVPQLLGRNVEDMLWALELCADLGYPEVNLNLGCPSGTVVSKGKGSGMLRDLGKLDGFLESIFAKTPVPVSVKTRLGLTEPEEFPAILEVYNRYPIAELTVHPRVRKAFYQGQCHLDAFAYAAAHAKAPLCYNGDLHSKADIQAIRTRFPSIHAVMIGRALVGDPGMLTPTGTDRETLAAYLEEMAQTYCVVFESRRNAVYRMKENWHFLIALFEHTEKPWKILRKTTDFGEFCRISQEIVHAYPMKSNFKEELQ